MTGDPRPGRRTEVHLSRRATCIVWPSAGPPTGLLSSEVNAFRKAQAARGNYQTATRDRVAALISRQPVAYAFYAAETDRIKIGMTANLLNRWAKLEREAGCYRQLVSVWPSPHPLDVERALHLRWSDHRVFGEWFSAAPVLADLRADFDAINQLQPS